MTDAKEPLVIEYLRQEARDGSEFLYDVYGGVVCATSMVLDGFDTLTRERDAAANLLAVIHRDGGHHTVSVGFARSCVDAEVVVLQDRMARDEARAVTDAMIERAREAYRNAWWHEEAKADGEPFTMEARNRVWIAALTAALAQEDA